MQPPAFAADRFSGRHRLALPDTRHDRDTSNLRRKRLTVRLVPRRRNFFGGRNDGPAPPRRVSPLGAGMLAAGDHRAFPAVPDVALCTPVVQALAVKLD